jgi:hypothetical protein
MIFANCVKCDELILYGYEAGDEPCGKGVYDRVICEKCGTPNFIERVSMDGEVLSEEELKEKYSVDDISKHRVVVGEKA